MRFYSCDCKYCLQNLCNIFSRCIAEVLRKRKISYKVWRMMVERTVKVKLELLCSSMENGDVKIWQSFEILYIVYVHVLFLKETTSTILLHNSEGHVTVKCQILRHISKCTTKMFPVYIIDDTSCVICRLYTWLT